MSTKFIIEIINDDLSEADIYMVLEDRIDELIKDNEISSDVKINVKALDWFKIKCEFYLHILGNMLL